MEALAACWPREASEGASAGVGAGWVLPICSSGEEHEMLHKTPKKEAEAASLAGLSSGPVLARLFLFLAKS